MAKGKYEQWLQPEGLLKIEGWARDGLTDEQIAHNMGIAYSTLRVWRDKYPALSAALKKNKEIVDFEVENALLKRALGYKYKEVTKEMVFDKTTETYEMRITKEVIKEVAPDTTAQIFWLKNRQTKKWRDKPEETNNPEEEKVVIVNDLPK